MAWCFEASLQLPKGQLSFVERWPLMNPSEIVFILATYLVFVLKVGPILMEGRTPFQIRGLLVFYNTFKVVNSGILGYKFFEYIMARGLFPRHCEHDELTSYTIGALYWKFMATKIFDLCDTMIFVLRKKSDKVTFLHVYHHTFMVIITWSCLKYDPSDHWAFMGMINCAIHTIIYTYYGMSALGPRLEQYLWWKKYLSIIQIVQFALLTLHITLQTYISECPIHAGTYWIGLANLALFVLLFTDFSKRRYKAIQARAKDEPTPLVDFACVNQGY